VSRTNRPTTYKAGTRIRALLLCITVEMQMEVAGLDFPGNGLWPCRIVLGFLDIGAGDRDRTGDIQLGKLTFYH
jgi:hypothetical protein